MHAENTTLANLNTDLPSRPSSGKMTVAELEAALLAQFPAEDAQSWDRTGLLCGDPSAFVEGVAVALDATVEAVRRASESRCNVLLTHHPAFLDAPEGFFPASRGYAGPSSAIFEAVLNGVALMNFHTTLDASPQAAQILPGMLGLCFNAIVAPLDNAPQKGFGQLCAVSEEDGCLTLSQLAARCTSVFGRIPRVWGDPSKLVGSIVSCTGSAGEVVDICVNRRYDCLVCGELRYHAALDAAQAGLCIIELGHDTSELPLCAILAQAASAAGIDGSLIRMIDQSRNWWTPEATRR